MNLKRLLKTSLVFLLTFSMSSHGMDWSFLGKWQGPEPVELELPKGNPYLPSCEGLIEAMKSQTPFEEYITSQASTDGERFQLMADYGLFFSQQFHTSLRLALEDRGVKLVMPETKGYGESGEFIHNKTKPLRDFVAAIQTVYDLPEAEFDQFLFEIFEIMHDQAAGKSDEPKAKVVHLQLSRFFHSLKDPDNWKTFGPVVRTSVRSLMARSIHTYSMKLKIAHLSHHQLNALFIGMYGAMFTFFSVLYMGLFDVPLPFGVEPERWSDTSMYWSDMRNPALHVTASLAALFGPKFILNTYNQMNRFARWAKKYGGAPAKALLTRPVGAEYEQEFKLLSEKYARDIGDMAVTMDQACKEKNICTFSPVQVAYIGHIDILRIQAHAKAVEEQMQALGFEGRLGEMESAAVDLRNTPDSYRKQTNLIRHIHAYTRDFEKHKKAGEAAVAELKKQIEGVQANLKQVRKKPYDFDPDDYNEDLIMKNELLLARMTSDLEHLQAMELDQDQLLARNNQLAPFVEDLSRILKEMREEEPNWKTLADESRMVLDRMKLGGGE